MPCHLYGAVIVVGNTQSVTSCVFVFIVVERGCALSCGQSATSQLPRATGGQSARARTRYVHYCSGKTSSRFFN